MTGSAQAPRGLWGEIAPQPAPGLGGVPLGEAATARVWDVGALCHAIGDALAARFNPVTVQGEISGFSRAASGHCYFSLKDEAGQLRCAMFRRAAGLLDFAPREGDRVLARGRLGVYEARGDLQLVVESLQRAGQGALFEQFLRLKARLQAEGLFDAARKRPLPAWPRGIGLVTSRQAAALHDVVAALARRAPHIPVWLAPAAVQGASAPGELVDALSKLYRFVPRTLGPEADLTPKPAQQTQPCIDLILLVRGGGSIEDLWAFNDEQLARTIAASPVPVISGVGHESDFSIADFVADLRAPTPTAAAELAAVPRQQALQQLADLQQRLQSASGRRLERQAQRLDGAAARLGRPSARVAAHRLRLARLAQRLDHATGARTERVALQQQALATRLTQGVARRPQREGERLTRAALRLDLLDPRHVLRRGYAWLADDAGRPVQRAAEAHPGQTLTAQLADGTLDVQVTRRNLLQPKR